jgi:hypothetical protein
MQGSTTYPKYLYDTDDGSCLPMDITEDLWDNEPAVPFTSEACVQRQIAYIITTIAMTFLRKTEVLVPVGTSGFYGFNCLPLSKFRINTNLTNVEDATIFGIQVGESLGTITAPDLSFSKFEKKELYSCEKIGRDYFRLCFAVKVLLKDYAKPSVCLRTHIVKLKESIPLVEEIWGHFYQLIKDYAQFFYQSETEWADAKTDATRRCQGLNIDKEEKELNFSNPAVQQNHRFLSEYIIHLAKNETQFIPCFERVCLEWDTLIKKSWQSELQEAVRMKVQVVKISQKFPDYFS